MNFELVAKALALVRRRPLHFLGVAGQYFRFSRTKLLSPLVHTPENGIFLGSNVRIQRLSSVSAERPDGSVRIGDDSIIYEDARIEAYGKATITIGAGSILGAAKLYSRASITLGARVMTSWNVFIQDFDPHPADATLRRLQVEKMVEGFRPIYREPRSLPPLDWDFAASPIEIGDDVWLGANTTILQGAKIGAGSIVATGAVVTKGEYPPGAVLAGIPAKVVKQQ